MTQYCLWILRVTNSLKINGMNIKIKLSHVLKMETPQKKKCGSAADEY